MASSIKAKADAEAAQVEAELGTDEPADEPDGPTEPTEPTPDEQEAEETEEAPAEPEPAAEPDDPEAQRKAFDRAMKAFHAKLCALFEVDDLVPVQIPGAVGFMLPGTFEQKAHDNFKRCLTCNGHGAVLTGSFKTGEETTTCPDPRCKGRGYWQKGVAEPVQAPPLTGPTAPENAQNGEWGEAPAWMGDPNITSAPPAVGV